MNREIHANLLNNLSLLRMISSSKLKKNRQVERDHEKKVIVLCLIPLMEIFPAIRTRSLYSHFALGAAN